MKATRKKHIIIECRDTERNARKKAVGTVSGIGLYSGRNSGDGC